MKEKLNTTTAEIMDRRFGKDNVIALSTAENNKPYVRYVNAYYEGGAFYIITHGLSAKMRQLSLNPQASIAGDWFQAEGIGESLGFFGSEDNKETAEKLKEAFSEWIDNGHSNLSDKNTVILKIKLTEGVLFSHGTRYHIDFT